MDISKGEMAEASIDAFIAKRDTERRQSEGERVELEAWQVTERIHDARKARAKAADWYRYKLEAADRVEHNAAIIAARNRAEAARILANDLGGKLEPTENGHTDHKESA